MFKIKLPKWIKFGYSSKLTSTHEEELQNTKKIANQNKITYICEKCGRETYKPLYCKNCELNDKI